MDVAFVEHRKPHEEAARPLAEAARSTLRRAGGTALAGRGTPTNAKTPTRSGLFPDPTRVSDELLGDEFSCAAEAGVVIGDWREDYNTRRPHSALGMRTPAVFAAEWTTDTPAPVARHLKGAPDGAPA
jgi:hypothetical protein